MQRVRFIQSLTGFMEYLGLYFRVMGRKYSVHQSCEIIKFIFKKHHLAGLQRLKKSKSRSNTRVVILSCAH